MEGVFGVPSPAALLQEFVDGQGGLFAPQPALVLGCVHQAVLALLCQGEDG